MTIPLKISYMGPSMNPTLKAGDVLKVDPYRDRKIRAGDIVVFYNPEEKQKVVHRVIKFDSQGVKTRGDNNPDMDKGILPAERIIGRVASIERGKRGIPVYGGKWGILKAAMLRVGKRTNTVLSKMLSPVYHRLARAGIFRNILSPWIKPRVLSFRRPRGTEKQLVIGRWVIGRRLAGQNRWRIRRPFRLLVDESILTDENST